LGVGWRPGGDIYIEPFATYDADIFFISRGGGESTTRGCLPASGDLRATCNRKAGRSSGANTLSCADSRAILAAHGFDRGSRGVSPNNIDYEGVPAKIFRAEHVSAIAASVGRQKDKARIEQMLQQADLEKHAWKNPETHKLKLPTL